MDVTKVSILLIKVENKMATNMITHILTTVPSKVAMFFVKV